MKKIIINDKVELIDTTLRDGEQTAGISFSNDEKLEMVRVMNKIEIPWIEAGIPAMGEEECRLLKEMLKISKKSKIIPWNRAVINDIKQSIECGFSIVHISIPISDINIKYKFGKDKEWIVNQLIRCLDYTKSMGVGVIIGTEDSSRADSDFFLKIAEIGAQYGALRIRFSDTVGCLNPFTTKDMLTNIIKSCNLPLEFHGHNDFGVAAANSIAAISAGAAYVSVTSTGIGERVGNACLEEVAVVLKKLYDLDLNIDMKLLPRLTNIVEKASNMRIYEYKPIIGKLA